MNNSEKDLRTSGLLTRLCKTLNDAGFASKVCKENIQGNDYEILRTALFDLPDAHIPTICEYYFADFAVTSPDVLYFTGVVTIQEGVDKEYVPELLEAITRINAALPYGSFIYNLDASLLMFRVDSRYKVDTDDDIIADFMDMDIIHLAEFCKLYAPTVLKVANGAMDPEEFRHALGI